MRSGNFDHLPLTHNTDENFGTHYGTHYGTHNDENNPSLEELIIRQTKLNNIIIREELSAKIGVFQKNLK